MTKLQTIENKLGEVNFRNKLDLQFSHGKKVYPGEPSHKEYVEILKKRIKGYKLVFNRLLKKNVSLSPFLEFGAGYAQGSMLLVNKYKAQGFASDISDKTLSSGKKFLKNLKFTKMPNLIACDAYNLPFKDNSLAFVFCFQTLHHFPDPKPIFEEVYRVLKPGGHFYFGEEPVAQSINLNLWRRDMHLTWFEKILKATTLLHFLSRIGKSEVENNILEETFDLPTWDKAIKIFNENDIKIKIFPYGPTFSGLNLPFYLNFLLKLLGGGIDGLCKKQGSKKSRNHENIIDLVVNLNGKNKLIKKNNVYIIFNKEDEKKLYLPAGRQAPLPKVSILIPTLRAGKYLNSCLKSINNLNYPKKSLEIIVVNNGSKKPISYKLPAINFILKIINNKINYGYAKAINQGAKIATGDYLFITNDDVVLDKYCLKLLVTFMQTHPDVGVTGPGGHLGAMRYNFWLGRFFESKTIHQVQKADWIPGYGLMIKKSLFAKLGRFDERFFFSGEDLDLCLKAKKLGFKIIYYPKAKLKHISGATVNKPEKQEFKYFQGYKSKWQLIIKQANILQIISALTLQIFVYMPYRRIFMGEKSVIPLFKALWWNIKNYGN